MTVPTYGNPDFLSYASWTTADLLAAPPAGYPTGVTNSAVIPVTHYGAVMLRMLPSASQAKVTLNWWEDQAGTLGVGSDTWPVNIGTGLLAVMPTEGPFVSVTVNNTGVITMTGFFRLRLSNMTPGRPSYPITDDVAGAINFSLPASGFTKFTPGFIHSGQAGVLIRPHDAAAKVNYQLVTEDEAGNAQRILYENDGPVTYSTVLLPAVDTIMSLHATNTDGAAAHVFDVSLWAQPY